MAIATSGDFTDTARPTGTVDHLRWADVALTGEALPAGFVTFVMTDIEGSTRLFHKLGDRYADLLAAHRALLRASFAPHHGIELGTEGDSMLIALSDSAAAIVASLEAQRALMEHRWPDDSEVRVRIGVHSGDAEPVGMDYVSLALHQVARISSSAHGGQVVVSEATALDAGRRLPPDVTLTPLGTFQLRGFPQPERLFELHHPALPAGFPALRAVGVLAHNLPFRRSAFVGRAGERESIARLLRTTGLVSIVGLGGIGKSRLAVEIGFDVADRFADGVWLVELASVSDRAAIARGIAQAMDLADEPGQPLEDRVLAYLEHKNALLILDNCEHIVDHAAAVADAIMQRSPHVAVLATSREPLEVEGEVVWRIGPLPTVAPASVHTAEDAAASQAVELFVERAQRASPDFQLTDDNAADIASLVDRLNGIPLAIELAAAALEDRSLAGVLDGLSARFDLLTHGRRTAPSRHQTLRAALEWSLDLLEPAERRLFARLAVFAGTGSTGAVVGVCADDDISAEVIPAALRRLIRASLLVAVHDAPDRWSMLESIRELAALELAASGDGPETTDRFRRWFTELAEQLSRGAGQHRTAAVMTELAADHDNLRIALERSIEAGDADLARRLATAMAPFWMSHGGWTDGSRLLRAAIALPGGEPAVLAGTHVALGNLLLLSGDLSGAETHFSEPLEGGAVATDDITLARALAGCGFVAFRRSDLPRAERYWAEGLERAQRVGDDRVIAAIMRSKAIAAGTRGDQEAAATLLAEARSAAERSGDDQLLRLILASYAEIQLWLGNYRLAENTYGDALDLATAIGDLSARPLILAELGWIALLRGEPLTAQRLATDAGELAEDLGNPRVVAHAHRLLGEALVRLGRPDEANTALASAYEAANDLGAPAEVAGVLCSQACLALERLDTAEAIRLATAAAQPAALRHGMRRTSPEWVLGAAALVNRDWDEAERHFAAGGAPENFEAFPRYRANTLWGLASIHAARGETVRAVEAHSAALNLRVDMGDRLGIVDTLVGLAHAGATADTAAAALALVAADGLRADAGAVPTPREAAAMERAKEGVAAVDAAVSWEARSERGAPLVEAALAAARRILEASKGT